MKPPRTIEVERIARLDFGPAVSGEYWQVLYELRDENGERVTYMVQAFAFKASHRVRDHLVWEATGTPEAPTLNPSYLCRYEDAEQGEVRVHLFLRAGRIELCPDSTVSVRA